MHITELGGEYFRYDELRQELRGERTGVRYGLGARLQVQVSRVDLDGRRIEFRIFRGQDPARPNPRQAGKSAPSPWAGGRPNNANFSDDEPAFRISRLMAPSGSKGQKIHGRCGLTPAH